MKKSLILFVFIAFTINTFANIPLQSGLTNTQISEIIMMSKEANEKNGIKDPNKIYPGQTLTFLFQNGLVRSIVVEYGDSQWTILRDKLSKLIAENGPVVNYNPFLIRVDTLPLKNPLSKQQIMFIPYYGLIGGYVLPSWLITLILFMIVFTVFLILLWPFWRNIYFYSRRERETNAYNHHLEMIELLQDTGGEAVINIGDYISMSAKIPKQKQEDTSKGITILEVTITPPTPKEEEKKDEPIVEDKKEEKTEVVENSTDVKSSTSTDETANK